MIGRIFYDAAKAPSRVPTHGDGEVWGWILAVAFAIAGIGWCVLWLWDHVILAPVRIVQDIAHDPAPVLGTLALFGFFAITGVVLSYAILRPLRRWTR
jgi:hypothetical protein